MLFCPDPAQRLDHIADMLRDGEPSTGLIAHIADICEPLFSSHASQHIKELINAKAWTDATLALLAIELPSWKLRRIVYDEGEWHCAISHERELPEWLDGAIETHHIDLATAILKALVEGLRLTEDKRSEKTTRIPLVAENHVSCDNFG